MSTLDSSEELHKIPEDCYFKKLPKSVQIRLIKQDIYRPTPIQEQSYEAILSGKDILGQSMTGSGKTLAFLVPMINAL